MIHKYIYFSNYYWIKFHILGYSIYLIIDTIGYINVSSADINHINFETLAKDLKFLYLFSILYKLSCLASSSFRHSKRKCISSSAVNLHSLQIL